MKRNAGGWASGFLITLFILRAGGANAADPNATASGSSSGPKIILPALPKAPVAVNGDKAGQTSLAPSLPGASNRPSQVGGSAPGSGGGANAFVAPSPGNPPASSSPAPTPLQTALTALVGAKTPNSRAAQDIHQRREAIEAFYKGRGYSPIWLKNGDWTPAARAVAARLKQADEDGLDAAALAIPALGPGPESTRLTTELALTDSVVLYGEEASGGRVNARLVSSLIADPHNRLAPAQILSKIAASQNPAQTLNGFNPPQSGYEALRAQLARLRAQHRNAALIRIPPGRTLRIGMSDARTPLIRARLGLDSAPPDQNLVYDSKTAAAVAQFQRAAGMAPTGTFTPRTAHEMSSAGRTADLEAEIIANMELWRWAPRDLGVDRIEVNIPDYSLTLYHGDKAIHSARVVVGKVTTPTPIFSDTIRYIVVNPSWVVPQSIIKKEMLPKLATDPNYFQEMGYVVTHKGDLVEVRQPPGDRNALGHIKFLFPNAYDVYLHDTPERALFGDSKRAFSHGCVRVQDPFALGEDVLGAAHGWSEARLEKLIGDKERTIRVPTPLPIHIEYFTAFVDSSGELQLRPDIYGYTHKIEKVLGLVG
jgi:L,D-transpeptidase YcbB